MLEKLLKYEFKATGRTLLPLYGSVIAFAIVNRIFMYFNTTIVEINSVFSFIQALVVLGYVIVIAASSICTLIIVIQRFYKNLLKDEGYLMNTLPVSTADNILSKLIVAVAWSLICGIVILLSVGILLTNSEAMAGIKTAQNEIIFELNRSGLSSSVNIYAVIIEVIILVILRNAQNIMMFYTSMAIGHLSKRKRILSSFAAFIGLNLAVTIFSGLSGAAVVPRLPIVLNNNLSDIHTFFVLISIITIVITGILFIICNKILKDNLSLE